MTLIPIHTKYSHHDDPIATINGNPRHCCQAIGHPAYPRRRSEAAHGPYSRPHPRRHRATAWRLPHCVLIVLSLIQHHQDSLVHFQQPSLAHVSYKPPWPPPAATTLPTSSDPCGFLPSIHCESVYYNIATSPKQAVSPRGVRVSKGYCPWEIFSQMPRRVTHQRTPGSSLLTRPSVGHSQLPKDCVQPSKTSWRWVLLVVLDDVQGLCYSWSKDSVQPAIRCHWYTSLQSTALWAATRPTRCFEWNYAIRRVGITPKNPISAIYLR